MEKKLFVLRSEETNQVICGDNGLPLYFEDDEQVLAELNKGYPDWPVYPSEDGKGFFDSYYDSDYKESADTRIPELYKDFDIDDVEEEFKKQEKEIKKLLESCN